MHLNFNKGSVNARRIDWFPAVLQTALICLLQRVTVKEPVKELVNLYDSAKLHGLISNTRLTQLAIVEPQ